MKSRSAIVRELARVRALLHMSDLPDRDRAEQYGAQQALEWALGRPNTAAPNRLARIAAKPKRRK